MKKIIFFFFVSTLIVLGQPNKETDSITVKNLYLGLLSVADYHNNTYSAETNARIATEIIFPVLSGQLYTGAAYDWKNFSSQLFWRKNFDEFSFDIGPWTPRPISRIKPSPFTAYGHVPPEAQKIIQGPNPAITGYYQNNWLINSKISLGVSGQQIIQYDAGLQFNFSEETILKIAGYYNKYDKGISAQLEGSFGKVNSYVNSQHYSFFALFAIAGLMPMTDVIYNKKTKDFSYLEFGLLKKFKTSKTISINCLLGITYLPKDKILRFYLMNYL